MKIEFPSFQPILSSVNKKETTTENNNEAIKLPDPKEELKEFVQNYIEEFQKALNEKGEDNPKVQRLMNKFRFGKKLTSQEMAYIRKHAPGLVDYVKRIMREREIVERGMKIAPTKHHVQMVAFHSAKLIEKGPSEDRIVLSSHLSDAKKEYEKTDEYKEKPTSPLERAEKLERKKYKKKKHYQYITAPINTTVHVQKKKFIVKERFEKRI